MPPNHDLPLEAELVAVKTDPRFRITEAKPWPAEADGSLRMHAGDLYALRLTNRGRSPAFVTLLIVDPDLGIEAVVPDRERPDVAEEQRLEPGEVRLSDAFRCDAAVGSRQAIAFATAGPNELWYAAQDRLPKIRGGRSSFEATILELTRFRTRGASSTPSESAHEGSVRVIRWDGCGAK